MTHGTDTSDRDIDRGRKLAARVEAFVREVIIPHERDPRCGPHGPSEEFVVEMRSWARDSGLLTPHILPDGSHLTHRETALVLRAAGLSPLGPVALNVAAPDEGNMFLLGRVATQEQKARFLQPLINGSRRSAFFMTEPAAEGGAGSDPSMLKTTARRDGDYWIVNGRKAFITGALGAGVGIVMAKSEEGATLFLVDLPDPAIHIERVLDTIDSSMPGGHAVVRIENLRVPASQIKLLDLVEALDGRALAESLNQGPWILDSWKDLHSRIMDYLECNTIADVAKAVEQKKSAAEKSKRGRRASNKKS